MPRLFSAALLREKNQVESLHVITFLFQLEIIGGPASRFLANYDQPVVFHGVVFDPFPVDVDALEDASAASLVHLQLTATTVNQEMMTLLDTYWLGVLDPDWRVTVWQIDTTQPDEMPWAAGEHYTVATVATDLRVATFDLIAEGLTLSELVPRRRYTSTSGFLGIPRR